MNDEADDTIAVDHSFGMLGSAVNVLRRNAMDYAMLGAGAAGAITLTDLALSKFLVSNGRPLVPEAWGPAAIAAMSIALGELTRRKTKYKDFGVGMIAGGVGVGIAALVSKFTSPGLVAVNTTADTNEVAGLGAQQTAGFGFGRAFAGGGGFGAAKSWGPDSSPMLFGVGTPNMQAAGMFNGATVAIEENGGMSGATVAIEEDNAFAGTLN